MSSQRRVRFGLALALGAMLVTLIAAPASAATTTIRYVDDNPNATSCRGTHFHSIQAAIDASNAEDIVYVCPGTYHESLVIDVLGLTVYSTKLHGAHLVPPASSPGAAVVIEANRASLFRFSIDVPAGTVQFPASPTGNGPSCTALEAAVVVVAVKNRVVNNRIDSIGDATLSGNCGYLIGVLALGDEPVGFTQLAPDKVAIKKNYIRDFKLAGILAGGDMSARILRNNIRFVHQDDPFTCVPINTVTVGEQGVTFPCETFAGQGVNPLNGVESFSVGIGAGLGAHVDIMYNTVFSTADVDFDTYPLLAGIGTIGAADGSRVSQNVVTQVFIGLAIEPFSISLAGATPSARTTGLPPTSGNIDVTFNRANEGMIGILVDGFQNYVYANRTRLNELGIATFSGEENYFNENDSRFNFDLDCLDDTTGGGTDGTANYWDFNVGWSDFPDICYDPDDN